jgi:hypothetical protein
LTAADLSLLSGVPTVDSAIEADETVISAGELPEFEAVDRPEESYSSLADEVFAELGDDDDLLTFD